MSGSFGLVGAGLLAVGLTIIVLAGGCATAPEAPAVDAGIDPVVSYARSYLETAARKARKGGIGLVVVADGETVLIDGAGYADRKTRAAITPETVFRFGSISKLFTAISVMQLVEAGQVDLDAPYRDYVPEFSIRRRADYPPITVRDLLTHHAGLPGDVFKDWAGGSGTADSEAADGEWRTKYRQAVDLLAQEYATDPPGTAFSYSNIGFSLLGVLVERVSGAAYTDYVRQHIFEPLDMASAGFLPGEGGCERMATGYPSGKLPADAYSHIRDIPAGSVFASLRDMSRFLEMLAAEGAVPSRGAAPGGEARRERILEAASFTEMARPQNADVPRDLDFRIGLTFWLVNPTSVPDVELMSHGGDLPPFHAVLTSAPGEDLAVLTVTNGDRGAGAGMDVAITIMQRLLEERRGRRYAESPLPQQPEVPLSEQQLTELSGYWTSPLGLVEAEGRRGRLRLKTMAGTLTAIHRGDGYFSADVRILGIPVVKLHPLYLRLQELDGEPILGLYQQGILTGYLFRHEPGPVPQAWQERAGKYEILNPDPVMFIRDPVLRYDSETGLLSVQVNSPPLGGTTSLPLNVVDDTLVVTAGYGRLAGETLQLRREEGEELIFYSGLKMRRVE